MKTKRLLGLCLGLGFLSLAVSCKKDPEFTIKFVDYDQTVLQTFILKAGELPNFTLEEPTREATAQYTYTFAGWDKEVDFVTGDATYTAVYEETVNSYTVTFADENGSVLQSDKVEYGVVPEFKGAEPEKEATTEFSYRFDGWDKELAAVTGDVTYTAQYVELKNAYKVSFLGLDGSVLYEANFDYGEVPEYKGETPTLEGDVQYSYEFAGWDQELTAVTGETTYRVQFNQLVNKYSVKWVDEEGTVLDTQQVEYGTVPAFAGTLPTLPENTAQYTYSGAWDKEFAAVTGDATYQYNISSVLTKHTITFVNYDNEVLYEVSVPYGDVPVYAGSTPIKPNTAQYGYEFSKWDKELVAVTGATTYTAEYSETIAQYTIRFLDGEGNELYSQTLEYGQTPVFGGTLPQNTVQYTYTGAWDREFETVTGDATYTYTITATTINSYSVTFNHLNLDGTVALAPVTMTQQYNSQTLYNDVYTYTAPEIAGKVPSHDYIKYIIDEKGATFNIYYSEVDTLTAETVASASLSGAGTEADPYLIQSAADFLYFKNTIANYTAESYFKMTKSINLAVKDFKFGQSKAHLDGNNCTIRGIDIAGAAGDKYTALFYALLEGSIKNLSTYGTVVQENDVSYAGAVVGCLTNGSLLENVTNYCKVSGFARVGGLTGWHKNKNTTLLNCVNYGTVTARDGRAGGMIGHSSEKYDLFVTNCINFGSVAAPTYAGGIVGYCQNSYQVYTNCVNFGTITASTNYGGGITGYSSMKLITGCINYGYISSPSSGAIAGQNSSAATVFEKCVNYGVLTKPSSEPMIGRLSSTPTITDCVNYYVAS